MEKQMSKKNTSRSRQRHQNERNLIRLVFVYVLEILKYSSCERVFHFREWKKVGWYEVRYNGWLVTMS
jgi:hypothetical protein